MQTTNKPVWWQSRGAVWRTVKRLSVLQLIPLALFCWVREWELSHSPGKRVESVVWSPDGKRLYGSGRVQTPSRQGGAFVTAWDVRTGRIVWQLPPDPLRGGEKEFVQDVSSDGKRLLLRGEGQDAALVRDAGSGELLYRISNPRGEWTQQVCFMRNGDRVIVVTQLAIHFWRLGRSGSVASVWERDTLGAEQLRVTPLASRGQEQGELLITRSGKWETNTFRSGSVELWNLRDGKKRITLAKGNHLFASVTPDEKQIVVGGRESAGLSLYERQSGRRVGRIEPGSYGPLTNATVLAEKNGVLQVGLTASKSWELYRSHLRWNVKAGRFTIDAYSTDPSPFAGDYPSPDGLLFARTNRGNGKKHPPLITLRRADAPHAGGRDLEGEAGWRPGQ